MQTASTQAGKRLLDYLDIHYYFAADTSANDAAAKALRLRMTRSLWGIKCHKIHCFVNAYEVPYDRPRLHR